MAIVLLGVVPLFGWLASRVPRLAADHHHHAVLRRQPRRCSTWPAAPGAGWRRCSTSGSASSTSSSSRSSGRLPTTSTRKGRGGGSFRWSASARRWARGSAPPVSARWSGAWTSRRSRLMLLAAVVLVLTLSLTWYVNQRETARADPEGKRTDQEPLGKEGRLRAGPAGPLPPLDRGADHPAQHRQHRRRVPAEPDRRRRGAGDRRPWRTASGS